MQIKSPITKIKNLFNNYADEECVTAAEYNGNITALKAAIEHNGEVLKEHETAIQDLVDETVPVESIDTNKIADEAVTLNKLGADVLDNSVLMTQGYMPAMFKNLLNGLHKTNPDLTGTFLNGAIIHPNKTLKVECGYTTKVEHDKSYIPAWSGSDEILLKNDAAPETYDILIKNLAATTYYVNTGWVITYTLDKACEIYCNDKNNLSFEIGGWRTYLNSLTEGTINFKIELFNSNNVLINTKNVFEHTSRKYSPGNQFYNIVGVVLKENPDLSLKDVKTIKVTVAYKVFTDTDKGFKGGYDLDWTGKIIKPVLNIALTNLAGADNSGTVTVPVDGKSNKLQISTRVKTSTKYTENNFPKLNFEVFCSGVCKNPIITNVPTTTPSPVINQYVPPTKNMYYNVAYEGTDTEGKHVYFITQDFEAPLIISAQLSGNKCYTYAQGCNPSFGNVDIEGEKKTFDFIRTPLERDENLDTHLSGDTFIYPENAKKTVEDIRAIIEAYNTKMQGTAEGEVKDAYKQPVSMICSKYVSLDVGNAAVNIRLSTSNTKLTVDSICVTKLNNNAVNFDIFEYYVTEEGADE